MAQSTAERSVLRSAAVPGSPPARCPARRCTGVASQRTEVLLRTVRWPERRRPATVRSPPAGGAEECDGRAVVEPSRTEPLVEPGSQSPDRRNRAVADQGGRAGGEPDPRGGVARPGYPELRHAGADQAIRAGTPERGRLRPVLGHAGASSPARE